MKNQLESNPLFPAASLKDFLLITCLWGIAVLLANPSGNFPLNDDWSYGIAVKKLLESGTFDPTLWTSMSLISQVLWGGFFGMLFGFSFEVLRLSTLVLSLLGVFALYLTIRQLEQGRWLALFVSLIVAFNPIYFSLSNTFMTDIPFTSFSVMALLFFSRYIRKESKTDFLLGSVFSTLAILCRQSGLFIPLAFAVALLYLYRLKPALFLKAAFPLLLGVAALKGFQYWLDLKGRTPDLYGLQIQKLFDMVQQPSSWPFPLAKNSYIALMYLGLFLLPVLFLFFIGNKDNERISRVRLWIKRSIVPLCLLLGALVVWTGKSMPLGGNILNKAGIGPLSLHDVHFLNLPNAPELPAIFWWVLSFLSVIGAACLLLLLSFTVSWMISGFKFKNPDLKKGLSVFYFSGAGIYFLPILFLGFYDRYLIMMMVLLSLSFLCYLPAALDVSIKRPAFSFLSISMLVALAIISIVLTHDYFSWNRARWQALKSIQEKEKLPGDQVNGGFEFNGWYLFSENSWPGEKKEEWWTEEDDLYILAFGEVPGYSQVRSYEYSSWARQEKAKIFILKRNSPQANFLQLPE